MNERLGVGEEDDAVGRGADRLVGLAREGIEDCGEEIVLADVLPDGGAGVEHPRARGGDGDELVGMEDDGARTRVEGDLDGADGAEEAEDGLPGLFGHVVREGIGGA